MPELSVHTILKHATFTEYITARDIYFEVLKYQTELPFIVGIIYKAGIIEGKRQERAKRNAVVAHE